MSVLRKMELDRSGYSWSSHCRSVDCGPPKRGLERVVSLLCLGSALLLIGNRYIMPMARADEQWLNRAVNRHFGSMVSVALATMMNDVSMVEHLLGQGADPNRPVPFNLASPTCERAFAAPGERALHIAGRCGNVQIVRLLLQRSHADPNATDFEGCTPLMATCEHPDVCVEVVRLLLEAGADPVLSQANGVTPLHMAALHGNIVLADMLYSRAPDTLNRRTSNGITPLFVACKEGHESMSSKLMSLGATVRVPSDESNGGLLALAVHHGFVGVVRALISEGGIMVVGGGRLLRGALYVAVRDRRAVLLQLLLTAGREVGQLDQANTKWEGIPMLHYGVSFCYPAAVSILLNAGADETARGSMGRITLDVIGRCLGLRVPVGLREAFTISTMLQRGPAYRARSWAWPSDKEADPCDTGDGDTAAAADGARTPGTILSPSAVKTPAGVSVQIFRLQQNGSSKLCIRHIDRYCAKD